MHTCIDSWQSRPSGSDTWHSWSGLSSADRLPGHWNIWWKRSKLTQTSEFKSYSFGTVEYTIIPGPVDGHFCMQTILSPNNAPESAMDCLSLSLIY